MTGKFWGLEEAPAVREATERPRKNTIERFNDELSVLERPLEGDVEYYDEAPPPSRFRRVGAFVLVAGLTCAGSLFVMRHFANRAAVAPPAPVPVAIAAPIAAPAAAEPAVAPPSPPSSPDRAAPAALAAADPAPAAPELTADKEAPAADDAADDAPAARQAASAKPTHGSRHSRHGKSGGRHHGHHQHH